MNDDGTMRGLPDDGLESKVARTVSSLEALLGGQEPGHATYEELAALVDGTLDNVQEEIVRTHLDDCAMCAAELAALREVAQPPRPVVVDHGAWGRTFWLVAALLIVAIGIGSWLVTRPSPEPMPGQTPATVRNVVELRDAGGTIALDERGQVHGVAGPLAGTAAALLQAPLLAPPAVLAAVRTVAPVLRGSHEQQLAVVAPAGRVVLEDRPQFSWSGARGSARVTVYEESSAKRVATSEAVRGGVWTPSAPLPRGVTLVWQVASGDELAPSADSGPARFRIVDAQAAARIGEARQTGSHLLLGKAFADAGLRDDAEAELRQLVALNPQSPVARSLLASVASWPR
jgi:hypothetical protein